MNLMSPPIDGMASDKLSQSLPGERCHNQTLHLPLQPLSLSFSLCTPFTSFHPSIKNLPLKNSFTMLELTLTFFYNSDFILVVLFMTPIKSIDNIRRTIEIRHVDVTIYFYWLDILFTYLTTNIWEHGNMWLETWKCNKSLSIWLIFSVGTV